MRHNPPSIGTEFYSGAETIHTGHSDPAQGRPLNIDCNSTPVERLDTLLRTVLDNRFNPHKMPCPTATDAEILSWSLGMICESPIGRALALSARQAGWSVGLEDEDYESHDVDLTDRALYLPRGIVELKSQIMVAESRHAMMMNLVRGLRDIWHITMGHATPPDLCPQDLIKKERIFAADLDSLAVCVAWDLRSAHHNEVWRTVLSGPLSDMAMNFMGVLKGDNRDNIPLATAYAFHQWYKDDGRVSDVDRTTLEAMDYVLNTSAVRNPFGSQRLSPNDIERMMRLPSGEQYLLGLAPTILHDPNYMRFSDPFNEAHLYHIMKDLEVTRVEAVSFRDADLARRIFPGHNGKNPV